MGLGLLLLVSVGKENIYLSSEPEITFFKIELPSLLLASILLAGKDGLLLRRRWPIPMPRPAKKSLLRSTWLSG